MIQRPCKRCGKPIRLAQNSTTGKWIPFDPEPVVFSVVGDIAVKPEPGPIGEIFMISHFYTCPHADEFSKSKNKKDEHQLPLDAPVERHFSEPKDPE